MAPGAVLPLWCRIAAWNSTREGGEENLKQGRNAKYVTKVIVGEVVDEGATEVVDKYLENASDLL